MSRQKLATYGQRGHRVAVFAWVSAEGPLVSAEWYEAGLRRRRSWRDTRENRRRAKAWAESFADERVGLRRSGLEPLTLRALWDRYTGYNWGALRPATQTRYADHWQRWELFAGRHILADHVSRDLIHGYRRELERAGLGVHSVASHLQLCKTVFNWAEAEDLLEVNKFRTYRLRIAKNERRESPGEYTEAEVRALLKALDPLKASQWRAWVAVAIHAHQGIRQNAGLQLRWTDLELRRRVVRWPKETDKNGRALEQPLRRATVQALRVARDWAKRQGVTSPYVLYGRLGSATGQPYGLQSFWKALRAAEERAGVVHRPYRAGHAFRRKVVGDLAELTGDTLLALRAVGDRDPRMAERYRMDRSEQTTEAFRGLDRGDDAGRGKR